jgi:hypothetical protein
MVERMLMTHRESDQALRPMIAHLASGSLGRAIALTDQWPVRRVWVERFGQDEAQAWLEHPLPETREDVERWLEAMIWWLRDVAFSSAGRHEAIAHRLHAEWLQRHARRVDVDRCLEAVLALVELRESLEQFVSPRLVAALARERWLGLLCDA